MTVDMGLDPSGSDEGADLDRIPFNRPSLEGNEIDYIRHR